MSLCDFPEIPVCVFDEHARNEDTFPSRNMQIAQANQQMNWFGVYYFFPYLYTNKINVATL